ncbi:7652_t:CDS:2, partial [Gigaspora rosea]
KIDKLLTETTIDFITNKIDQQQFEYPDEDDNLNEDDCCAECENTTDTEPDTFKHENFTLRQAKYGSTRRTEIFILITIDDEDKILLSSTLYQITENIAYLCSLRESLDWDEEGWKKIDGFEKSKVNNKTIRAHIYEYTTPISIKCSRDSVDKKAIIPTQILFCLQENSKEKIDSHRWFFDAFCPILNPRICILIKVGIKPDDQSIYNLWKTFKNDQVAGSCGKLNATKNRSWIYLLNPLVDFSAYRYSALLDTTNNIEDKYINNILTKNDYLAKNNAICFELVSKTQFFLAIAL